MAMLVNPVDPRVEYTATSGQTTFTIPFEFLADEDIEVWIEGVAVAQADMTITGEGTNGSKQVVLDTGTALGNSVVILRNTEIKRLTDFPVNGPFDIEQLNEELDNIFLILQELREFDGRVLALDPTVPDSEANWDAQGRRIINLGYPIDSTDATSKLYVDTNDDTGDGSGGGGGGDTYTTVQIDVLLQALETELTTLITTTVNTAVTTAVAAALATSYRIREVYKYTGPGTFVKPAWCTAVRIIACGGGGGGAYADGNGTGEIGAGNGGSGSATAVSALLAASGFASLAVTIGAGGAGGVASTTTQATNGGTSSVIGTGVSVTSTGGIGASAAGVSTAFDSRGPGSPGLGGTGVTGELYAIPGQSGGRGVAFGVLGNGFSGDGGDSYFGRGGQGQTADGAGQAGSGYGSGGSGGFSVGTSNRNGGAGAPGIVLIEAYE